MESTFVVVRHGETEWSASGRHTSVTDLDLTEQGAIAARSVGAIIDRMTDEVAARRVYVSPRRRAQRTASLALGGGASSSWTVDDDLAEWAYGDYEGLRTSEIEALSPGWELFTDGCPNGETITDVEARCDHFIASTDGAADVILAFCHGHLSRVLTARLLGYPGTAGRGLWNDTASVAMVRVRRGVRILTAWNVRN